MPKSFSVFACFAFLLPEIVSDAGVNNLHAFYGKINSAYGSLLPVGSREQSIWSNLARGTEKQFASIT